MKIRMNRIALVGGACAVTALLAIACSSGSKKKTPGGNLPPPVEKGTGGAANFACNHSFTDGPAGTTTNEVFHMIVQKTSSPGTAPAGATLTFINPANASTSGMLTYTVVSSGNLLIPVVTNTRLAWKNHAPADAGGDNYVDTYEFNRLTLTSSAAASGSILTRIVDQAAYGGLFALATGQTTPPAGTAQIAGAVNDCDGDTVKNAQVVVSGATACSATTPPQYPCIAYFKTGFPNRNATATDIDGQFLVLGAQPGAMTVTVVGTTSGTATSTIDIGSLDVVGVGDSVSLGATTPLKN